MTLQQSAQECITPNDGKIVIKLAVQDCFIFKYNVWHPFYYKHKEKPLALPKHDDPVTENREFELCGRCIVVSFKGGCTHVICVGKIISGLKYIDSS
ncbi:hypothetical protein AVEN_64860-1 [Araneus ventricosus]|uniref:Uncharacterized protein n=1 Tax=Araneus ventricosus TaxID=182803 RepID=A0A4Y2KAC9_ARAVE|nr:hypothetical protein AVEN_100592-1 [Araneus ventricosus]GBM98603.1 hypothetical protein AVEN_122335-1 [Araneus ventricosus]GBM98615.1 hypothetical protein AVEN_220137-1 [Araneus ventricosus]GBM98665.1 hypothetical protein AVEN_64860-1 [Araneus ventricosus]